MPLKFCHASAARSSAALHSPRLGAGAGGGALVLLLNCKPPSVPPPPKSAAIQSHGGPLLALLSSLLTFHGSWRFAPGAHSASLLSPHPAWPRCHAIRYRARRHIWRLPRRICLGFYRSLFLFLLRLLSLFLTAASARRARRRPVAASVVFRFNHRVEQRH